jgi:hypothetical protein
MNTAVWTALVPVLARLTEEGPAPEDVKAGWLGFAVFLLLAVAVAFLGFSLRKHLRKVDFEEEPDETAGTTNGAPSNGEARNGA